MYMKKLNIYISSTRNLRPYNNSRKLSVYISSKELRLYIGRG